MKAHANTLEAIIVYMFFFGLSTGSFGLTASGFIFASKESGLLAILNAVLMLVSGYLGVSCYKGLRVKLQAVDAAQSAVPAKQGDSH